jgi:hypothetical protein
LTYLAVEFDKFPITSSFDKFMGNDTFLNEPSIESELEFVVMMMISLSIIFKEIIPLPHNFIETH